MKTTQEMAREAGLAEHIVFSKALEAFAALVREEALAQPEQEPFEYWNAVEGWVKIDEVREHFDSVGCGTIYKTAGDGRVPLTAAQPAYRAVKTFHEGKPVYVAQKRPPNCGTSFCSCIECIMEKEQK